jgi:beta-mannanase
MKPFPPNKSIQFILKKTIPLVICLLILVSASGEFHEPVKANGTGVPVLLGIDPQGYITQDVIDSELHALDSWAGKGTAIAAIPLDIEEPNPEWNITNQLNLLWDNGFTPYVNLIASISQPSAYQIAAGYYDNALNQWAQIYASWAGDEHWSFISVLPEMNVPWTSYGMNPINYILAYNHIQEIFAQNNVPADAVRWVFAPNGWYGNSFEEYYPGDEHIDIVSFSAYNFGYCPENPTYWQGPEEVFHPYITQIHQMAPSKPIFVSTGTSAYVGDGQTSAEAKNQWLRDTYDHLANILGVQAILYNNQNLSWSCDWAVYKTGSIAYTGYQDGIANPSYAYLSPQELGQVDFTLEVSSTYLPIILDHYHWWESNTPTMVGVYPGDWLGDQSIINTKLHALDDWTGKGHSLAGLFIGIELTYPDTHVTGQLEMLWENGYVPFVNMTTSTRSAYEVASGAVDPALRTWARAFKTYTQGGTRTAFIAVLQEMDGYWVPYGLDPANFKLAFKHVQQIFQEEGVSQDSVIWTFAPTAYVSYTYPPFEDYYPGDAWVDAVGFSAYNFGYCPISSNQYPEWKTHQTILDPFIERMDDMAPTKPVIIAQLGSSSYVSPGVIDNNAKSQWLYNTYTYLASESSVKGVMYFNFDKNCDYAFFKTWSPDPRQLDGYRNGVANPVFDYVSPFELKNSGEFNIIP